MNDLAGDALRPRGFVRMVLRLVIDEVRVARLSRSELVQDRVLGPARERDELAYADASRHRRHRGQAPLRVPADQVLLVAVEDEAPELNAGGKRVVADRGARLGSVDAEMLDHDVRRCVEAHREHFAIGGRQRRLELLRRRIGEDVRPFAACEQNEAMPLRHGIRRRLTAGTIECFRGT